MRKTEREEDRRGKGHEEKGESLFRGNFSQVAERKGVSVLNGGGAWTNRSRS